MKKLISVSVIMAVALLIWSSFTPTHAQDPANEEKPTFYHLVPGTYVNGWPRFTITYPKDWVEKHFRVDGGQVFYAVAPGPPFPSLGVVVTPYPVPLDKFADFNLKVFESFARDVTVVRDKPSQLRDGTPAREVEIQAVMGGIPVNWMAVALKTKQDDQLIHVDIGSFKNGIGEDLKAIAYSLEFQPDKDKPVKVPPDVQEFFDKWCSDAVSHDVVKTAAHFSDRFFHSGWRKGEWAKYGEQYSVHLTSLEIVITDFVPAGDRAYLAGFWKGTWWKIPANPEGSWSGKSIIHETSIIKENGEWKWYGNQRNPAP